MYGINGWTAARTITIAFALSLRYEKGVPYCNRFEASLSYWSRSVPTYGRLSNALPSTSLCKGTHCWAQTFKYVLLVSIDSLRA